MGFKVGVLKYEMLNMNKCRASDSTACLSSAAVALQVWLRWLRTCHHMTPSERLPHAGRLHVAQRRDGGATVSTPHLPPASRQQMPPLPKAFQT